MQTRRTLVSLGFAGLLLAACDATPRQQSVTSTGAADIGYAKSSNLVAVPDGRGTKVVFYELSWPEDDH